MTESSTALIAIWHKKVFDSFSNARVCNSCLTFWRALSQISGHVSFFLQITESSKKFLKWLNQILHILQFDIKNGWQFFKCQSLPFVPHILPHFVSNIKACKFQQNLNLDLVEPFGHNLIAEIFFHSSLNPKDTMRYICWYLEYSWNDWIAHCNLTRKKTVLPNILIEPLKNTVLPEKFAWPVSTFWLLE